MDEYRVIRSKTAADWTSENPYLKTTELGIESDTGRIKVGNGVRWSSTIYVGPTPLTDTISFNDADTQAHAVVIENGIITAWTIS